MFSKADVIAAFAGHLQTSGGNEDPDKPHLMIKEEFSAYSLTTVKWPEPGPASERTKLFALTHPLENLLEALVPSRRMSGASRWLNGKEDSCQCRRHRLSLCVREDPLEKEMLTHSSILAWEIPRTEEPGGLQYMGLEIVGQDLMTR